MSQDFNGKEKWVRTRKNHLCDMCGGPIPSQWEAHYYAGVYEGDFYAGWQHRQCWESFIDSGDQEWEQGEAPWPDVVVEWWKIHELEWSSR
jgi:hypothetical protein